MTRQTPSENAELLSTGTMVLWVSCLCVGVAGQVVKYPWPKPAMKEPPPVLAQMISVEIMKEMPGASEADAAASADMAGPEAAPSVAVPAAPPLTAVAAPSATIVFAVPVEGPSQVVEAKQAVLTPALKGDAIVSTARAPRRLKFGQGEGRQPEPEYPREAVMAGQEGTVLVRFAVGEDGRVTSAQAIKPCPFPLLNHAAVSAVRDTWRFPAGAARLYEVPIEFNLRGSDL